MHDDHDHPHDHCHEHDHHDHPHGEGQAPNKIRALLEYMLEHNRSHTGELKDLAEKLAQEGNQESADLINQGVRDFEQGNAKLAKALERFGGLS